MERNVDILYSSDGKPLIKGGYVHSAETKLKLISLYLQYGSLRKASIELGLHYQMTSKWKKEPWFKKAIAELKKQKRAERNTKIDKIIDKSLNAVEDRIDNGDYIYDQKTGEVVRKPVSLKEVRGVANDLLQRQLMIEKAAVDEQHMLNDQKVKEQLSFLQQEFAKFNTSRTVEVIPTQVENTGLHEESPQQGSIQPTVSGGETSVHEGSELSEESWDFEEDDELT